MDDFWKILGWSGLGLFVIHSGMKPWAQHNAKRQVRESFFGGEVRASVQSQGIFGMFTNDVHSVDIIGHSVKVDSLPFELHPKSGWKGRIHHLRLHLRDFQMAGLPVSRMVGEVFDAKYDLGYAFNKRRLFLRSAEPGTASVYLTADNALFFIQRKFKEYLQEGTVSLLNGRVVLSGKYRLFGRYTPFYASGRLRVREGRYIDLVEPTAFMQDSLLPPSLMTKVLEQLNPVVDVASDLHLQGIFTPTSLDIANDVVRVDGKLTVPLADTHRSLFSTKE